MLEAAKTPTQAMAKATAHVGACKVSPVEAIQGDAFMHLPGVV